MPTVSQSFLQFVALPGAVVVASAAGSPLVIAHRGASGYLPEHTLEAAAFAHALGADAIEQDVVLTRDGRLLVIHDVHLDAVTDVAERFPDRARADGRFYAIDFDLAEIRSLRAQERVRLPERDAVFPGRFPVGHGSFRLASFDEHVELIQGLNRSTGRTVALYVEFKAPAWHLQAGRDLGRLLLEALAQHGYRTRRDPVFVQCFDAVALERLRIELRTDLRLIQLIGDEENAAVRDFRSPEGLDRIASYADGIGPALHHVFARDATTGEVRVTALVAEAHRRNLLVHPYTLRVEALPRGIDDFAALHRILFREAGIDGAFTDFPDDTLRWLQGAGLRP